MYTVHGQCLYFLETSTHTIKVGVMMKKHSYLTVNIAVVGLFTFTTFKKVLSPVKT